MKDTSIFKGIVEFKSPDGESFRCEKKDGKTWNVFVEGDGFHFERAIFCASGSDTPTALYSEIKRSRAKSE